MPTLAPSKIVCVGRNYAAHARELGNEVPKQPLLFLKPPSSLISDGASIRLPAVSNRVEFEGEIGVVVGERLRKVSPDVARRAIVHLLAVNDVTARDLQKSDVQFTRAKGFDTFCPVGELGPVPDDLASLSIRTLVNGEVRQDGRAADMVFDIPALVAYISGIMTLEPAPGDVVEVEIAGVSRVSNPVSSDS
jgi:2-keto-4-pentenoate hydratase/2-oxohepta-3-ene-1,7-dioic acid hydratase in catechol pathway